MIKSWELQQWRIYKIAKIFFNIDDKLINIYIEISNKFSKVSNKHNSENKRIVPFLLLSCPKGILFETFNYAFSPCVYLIQSFCTHSCLSCSFIYPKLSRYLYLKANLSLIYSTSRSLPVRILLLF